MKNIDQIIDDEAEVLGFLKSRYPLYHLSNVFFRDIQYGIRTLLERRGLRVGYADAERIARRFAENLEKKRILVPVDRQSWVLYYEDFKTVSPKKAAPAKPAASKPGAARPAGGLPPLKSATPAGTAKPSAGLPPLKSSAPSGAAKPAGGLPPLKSSGPAGGSKPAAGLPPLKSSAPAGGTSGLAASRPEVPKAADPSPKKAEPVQEQPKASPQPEGKKGLPPITSSVPAGGKK